jgi:hypothetical protein|eukprot:COSAG01_NODE_934_length_12642_cov_100.963805_2_plen_47_part_00
MYDSMAEGVTGAAVVLCFSAKHFQFGSPKGTYLQTLQWLPCVLCVQ